MEILDQPLFFTSERQQRLDLVFHLIPNSRLPILLRGPAQSGKSFFLKQFERQKNKDWLVFSLPSDQLLDVGSPLHVLEGLVDQAEGSYKPITSRLIAWTKSDKKIVVIIEGCETLSAQGLADLMKISQSHACMRLLLASSESLMAEVEAQCQTIDLEPLTQQQAVEYAKFRITARNLVVDLAKIDKVDLFIKTEGLPGRINDVLEHQRLSPNQSTKKRGKSTARWVFIAALAVVIGALIYVFDGSFFDKETHHIVDFEQEPKLHIKDLKDNRDQVKQSLVMRNNLIDSESLVVDRAKAVGATAEREKSIVKEQSEGGKLAPAPAPVGKETEKSEDSSVTKVAPKLDVGSLEKAALIVEPSTTNVLGQHKWIKSRPKNHFTLQLIAVSNEATAQAYLNSRKDLSEIHFFQNKKNSRIWFSIIYGDFSSKQAAEQKMAKMPTSIKSTKPWLRSFGDIQRGLHK